MRLSGHSQWYLNVNARSPGRFAVFSIIWYVLDVENLLTNLVEDNVSFVVLHILGPVSFATLLSQMYYSPILNRRKYINVVCEGIAADSCILSIADVCFILQSSYRQCHRHRTWHCFITILATMRYIMTSRQFCRKYMPCVVCLHCFPKI